MTENEKLVYMLEAIQKYRGLYVETDVKLRIVSGILCWLAQLEGTVTIHNGVAVDESGMSVDLNQ